MRRLPGIQPSRGCTEPVAIALAAALAARAASGEVLRVAVSCDRGTLKNAQAPGIPGTGGLRGAALAAGLGALAGDPDRMLEVLAAVEEEDVARARELVTAEAVRVDRYAQAGVPSLWVEAVVETRTGSGRARLEGAHTRLVRLEVDGEPVARPAWTTTTAPRRDPTWEGLSLSEVLSLVDELEPEEEAALIAGLDTNLRACGHAPGSWPADDLATASGRVAQAGSLARMEGRAVTVTTSGFSGSQGLVASVPVGLLARELESDERSLARALAVSHLTGSYVRSFTGVLSPLCNALHAASAGAAAGCAHLLGGGPREVERAAVRVLATSGGVLCDGAKPSCSLKVELATSQAIRSAQRVVEERAPATTDGIAEDTLEATARTLSRIARAAMSSVDVEVLDVVLGKSSGTRSGE